MPEEEVPTAAAWPKSSKAILAIARGEGEGLGGGLEAE